MNLLYSALFGAFIAIAGAFLHNGYQPLGLIASLVALVWSMHLIRNTFNRRVCSIAFAVGWIVVVLRASTLGNGNELLIQGNTYGNLFAFGGSLVIAVTLIMSRYDR